MSWTAFLDFGKERWGVFMAQDRDRPGGKNAENDQDTAGAGGYMVGLP